MKRRILAAVVLVLAGLLSFSLREPEEFTRQGQAMNTIIRMTVYGNNALDDAYTMLNELDYTLSMYNPSSDISRINSASGHEVQTVRASTVEAVKDAVKLYEITGGVFNPLIGAVTKLWKINQKEGSIPSAESLDEAVKLSDIKNLNISGDNIFLREKGCVLDLGGIAKGYASSKIADFFRKKGIKSGIIDLGGNVYALGLKPDGEKWRIGVRNPLEPFGSPALVVEVENSSVITSGNYERFKTIDGKKYSHFFDTKTGESIISDLLSVTVITPDGSLGDGLATAFMITGVDEALRILGKMENSPGVIFITQEGIIATSNLKDTITRSAIPATFAEVREAL